MRWCAPAIAYACILTANSWRCSVRCSPARQPPKYEAVLRRKMSENKIFFPRLCWWGAFPWKNLACVLFLASTKSVQMIYRNEFVGRRQMLWGFINSSLVRRCIYNTYCFDGARLGGQQQWVWVSGGELLVWAIQIWRQTSSARARWCARFVCAQFGPFRTICGPFTPAPRRINYFSIIYIIIIYI